LVFLLVTLPSVEFDESLDLVRIVEGKGTKLTLNNITVSLTMGIYDEYFFLFLFLFFFPYPTSKIINFQFNKN